MLAVERFEVWGLEFKNYSLGLRCESDLEGRVARLVFVDCSLREVAVGKDPAESCVNTRLNSKVSLPRISEGYVIKFAPHLAQKLIA